MAHGTIRVGVDSIPPGRYMTPIVDGLNAYWAQITPGSPEVAIRIDAEWRTAPDSTSLVAIEQIVSSLHAARQTYGRFTGVCAVCALAIDDGDSRRRGGHRKCLDSAMTGNENVAAERGAIRRPALAALVDAWTLAPEDRRVRMLINVGPITLEKLDATTRRIKEGLPPYGMPAPDHTIRDREDPRIPDWAAAVAERMGSVALDRLPKVWHWVAVGELRHQHADLDMAGRVVRLVAKVSNVGVATSLLAEAAVLGTVLHANLSCQPHLTLQITALMPLPEGNDDEF